MIIPCKCGYWLELFFRWTINVTHEASCLFILLRMLILFSYFVIMLSAFHQIKHYLTSNDPITLMNIFKSLYMNPYKILPKRIIYEIIDLIFFIIKDLKSYLFSNFAKSTCEPSQFWKFYIWFGVMWLFIFFLNFRFWDMIRFQIFSIAHRRSKKSYIVLLVNISLRYMDLELFNLIYLSMRK